MNFNGNTESKYNNKKSEGESLKSAFKEIAFYTYGVPGTLPLLAALDEKLNFYPTLERFVIGYEKIVYLISDQLSKLIPFDWVQANVLVFELYILSHLAIAYFRDREIRRSFIWGVLSPLFLVTSATTLSIFYSTRFSEGLVNVTFQILLPIILLLTFSIFICMNFASLRKSGSLFVAVIGVIILLIYLRQSFYHLDYIYSSPFGGISNILFSYFSQVFIIISACTFGILKLKGPAIVGLWFSGIISFHWIVESGLPMLNRLADNIGI